MFMFRRRRDLASTTLLLALAGVLSACGGGDDQSAVTTDLEASAGIFSIADAGSSGSTEAPTAFALALGAKVESPAPSWASTATYYVDPSIGSDANAGLSPDAPRKTLTNSIKMIGVTVLLKRGTTIELRSNLYPRDTFIGTYGPSTAKPRVIVPAGYNYGIGVDSGQFKISDIVLIGNAATRESQPGIGATKAASVIVEYCEIQDYANGVTFSGTGSVVRNNRISRVTNNGIHVGSTKSAAASGSLISGNYINVAGAMGDGVTLHDGSGIGVGNRITGNMITGANRENAIDIQGQYADTLIEGNRIDGSGSYAIGTDFLNPGVVETTGTIIRNNTISNGTRAAIYSRTPNALISGNVISNIRSVSLAGAIAVEGSARILDNTVTVPATNNRPVFVVYQTAGVAIFGGEVRGNRIFNYSAQPFIELSSLDKQSMVDLWTIDGNAYTGVDVVGRWFMGMEFSKWTSGGNDLLRTYKDLNSTLVAF